MPDLYTKKPVTIRAVQFTGSNHEEITGFVPRPYWSIGPDYPGHMADGKPVTAKVYDDIHEAWIPVRDNDWIIEGLEGEYYPCDPAVFTSSYDLADA